MSKTNDLAIANGWDTKELGDKLDYAFQPVLTTIEDSQHSTTKVAVEQICVALKDCKEAVPHATIEDVCDTVAERVRRSKGYSRAAKMIAAISLMLWRVGFTTAEAIDEQLTRKSWQGLADRAVALQSAYDLIGRLYEAGLTGKGILSKAREAFRLAFASAKTPVNVKKILFETLLGFNVAAETFVLYVTGRDVEYTSTDSLGVQRISKYHVPSHLERYETAKSLDAVALKAGTVQDTATALRLVAVTIQAENEVYLKSEAEALALKAEAEKLAAQQKAEADNLKRLERLKTQQAEVAAKQSEVTQGEGIAEALNIIAEQGIAQTEAEAGKDPLQAEAAHKGRKAEASRKRKASRNVTGDVRIAA